ncbi:hypothetical protein BKA66DRAFT_587585 [Pyrenochaeta sp. MPI-SDFR-AT-0127]|nr:hypothetical protein BKA66DRAFT_587585 [Pyrenochaeta sp. MPI-SDFR-AT-0127]
MATAMAVSAALNDDFDSDRRRWPWRPSRRFTVAKAFGDVWADEADGRINDEMFHFFYVSKKMRYINWPKRSIDRPSLESMSVVTIHWRLATSSSCSTQAGPRLARSRTAFLVLYGGPGAAELSFDDKLMSRTIIENFAPILAELLGSSDEMTFGFLDTEVPICCPYVRGPVIVLQRPAKKNSKRSLTSRLCGLTVSLELYLLEYLPLEVTRYCAFKLTYLSGSNNS